MLIIRLAPPDYHRFHFPYSGTPSKTYRTKGGYLSVSPFALERDFVRVFCGNRREFCLLDTGEKARMLIAPVGATFVGSINETYLPGRKVNKGDEIGYFAFGGSSIVVLCNDLAIDEDILRNTRKGYETSIRMGERVGGWAER